MKEKKLSRREFLALSATTATGALLAACAPATPGPAPAATPVPKETPAAETAPTPTPAAAEKITLHFWHWDNFLQDPYTKEGEMWSKDFAPNVTVSFEPTTWDEYSQKMVAAMAGGTLPDLCGAAGEHQTTLGGKGVLTSLVPFIEKDKFDISDWHPRNLKQTSWKGTLVALPYGTDCMYWFYDLDEFQKQGLKTPTEYWREGKWTWDVATDLAQKLTKGSSTDKVWGVADPGVQEYYKFAPIIWENGGDLFDAQYTKALISGDQSLEAFKWAFDLRPFAPGPGDEKMGAPQSGKVKMWVNWDQSAVLDFPNFSFKYSFAALPASPKTGETVFIGDACSLGIPKGSPHPDLAWSYIKFLLTPESLLRLFVITFQPPPRLSMFKDASLFKQVPNLLEPDLSWELEQARWKNFRNLPKMDNWLEMWKAEQEEISLAWTDQQPLPEALNKVADRWNQLLKEADIDADAN